MPIIHNIQYEHKLIIFPQDTNYMPPMVFGGKMLSEMDIAAAGCVRRACNDSPAKHAVTTRITDVEFHVGAEVGDLIIMTATISKLGVTSIEVTVKGIREHKDGKTEDICCGKLIFVTVKDPKNHRTENGKLIPIPHELIFGDN